MRNNVFPSQKSLKWGERRIRLAGFSVCLIFSIACAGSQPKISDINQDFSDLSQRFETYNQSQAEALEKQQQELDKIRERIEQETQEITSSPTVVEPIETPPTGTTSPFNTTLESAQPSPGQSMPLQSMPVTSEPPPVTPAISDSASQSMQPSDATSLFHDAFDKYNQQQYNSAAAYFLLAQTYTQDEELKARCLYWTGECQYKLREWEKAISYFRQVEIQYPQQTIVPNAMLKEGYSYINWGKISEGKTTLRKLIDTYPQSNEAVLATERLRELNAL